MGSIDCFGATFNYQLSCPVSYVVWRSLSAGPDASFTASSRPLFQSRRISSLRARRSSRRPGSSIRQSSTKSRPRMPTTSRPLPKTWITSCEKKLESTFTSPSTRSISSPATAHYGRTFPARGNDVPDPGVTGCLPTKVLANIGCAKCRDLLYQDTQKNKCETYQGLLEFACAYGIDKGAQELGIDEMQNNACQQQCC